MSGHNFEESVEWCCFKAEKCAYCGQHRANADLKCKEASFSSSVKTYNPNNPEDVAKFITEHSPKSQQSPKNSDHGFGLEVEVVKNPIRSLTPTKPKPKRSTLISSDTKNAHYMAEESINPNHNTHPHPPANLNRSKSPSPMKRVDSKNAIGVDSPTKIDSIAEQPSIVDSSDKLENISESPEEEQEEVQADGLEPKEVNDNVIEGGTVSDEKQSTEDTEVKTEAI